jgi:exonuclease SbcC
MFDFFFKRFKPAADGPGSKPAQKPTSKSASKPASKPTSKPAPPTIRKPDVPDVAALRQQALAQADALGSDETAAAAFITACGVAEARLRAAQNIHTRAALETVQKAMRETDRRVARLMQQRLESLDRQEASAQRAREALERAQVLCVEPALRSNQVVEIEREWKAIDAPTAEAQGQFDLVHARLAQRLQAQTALQRRVLDTIAVLRTTLADPAAHADALDSRAQAADATLAAVPQDVELPSLPKQLLPELSSLREQLQRLLDSAAAASAALTAREQMLDAWESALAAERPPEERPLPAVMQRDWRALAPVADATRMQALQERFDGLLAQVAPPPVRKPKAAEKIDHAATGPGAISTIAVDNERMPADPVEGRIQFGAALAALQGALEEGALQQAMEQDRLLRGIDIDGLRLPAPQQAALSAARAELGRLQGWARWGGTVSREELLAAVEALPQQGLPVTELAKKVGSMRERWRGLDASAGVAPRALWTRFDAACTSAYAPVAAHFAVLAQERAANAAKAQMLLDEIAAFVRDAGLTPADAEAQSNTEAGETGEAAVATASANQNAHPNPISNPGPDAVAVVRVPQDTAAPDWRAIAAFCQRMRQAWQKLGTIERKEHKRLDAAFARALQPLLAPMAAQQDQQVAQRERLIEDVAALPPQARETPERLQALQARWQQQAKSFPLDRQIEQALWQRFRSACDAVFAARKSAGAAADAERNASLQEKTALCVSLEALAGDDAQSEGGNAARLRDIRHAWEAAGPVPRAAQATLQARFEAALHAIDARADARQRALVQQRSLALTSRLQLCFAAEHQLATGAPAEAAAALSAQWTDSPEHPDPLAQPLQARFDAAIAALEAGDRTYAHLLEQNQAVRDAQLLRLEVEYGIESPAQYTRERLALQVAGLQSAFRSGVSGSSQASARLQLADLCRLPALTDALAQGRLERVVAALLRAS